MNSTKWLVIVLVAAVVIGGGAALLSSGGSGETRSIHVTGSTTVLPIAQAAAENWMNAHPNDQIFVAGGGSGVGIASLIDGTCDIADASREVKASENESAGGNLIEHEIALDAVCVIVNQNNSVNGLTTTQIKQIFTGGITNWSEVGGADLQIVVYTRESTSGTLETFKEKVMGSDNITVGAITKNSNGEMTQAISDNPNGIGYVGIGYLATSGIKGLKVNGVQPSSATVWDRTYPITRSLYMVTHGEPQGLAKDFIDFVRSSEGQEIVVAQGFVSLPFA